MTSRAVPPLFHRTVSPTSSLLARPGFSRELGMSVQGSIVIGGGAFAGLALALALRQGLGPELPVIVAPPTPCPRATRTPRATAIVAACRRLFEAIGAWDDVRG